MFYSEELFQKTGPLARVWLSANLERKLSKQHILQSNLSESVEQIIMPTQAPMALRMTGQLLLGVVRIYSRKARYLLDDCNEALLKIKMAFRSSGNNDIPANLQLPNRESLLLPDKITPYDNLDLLPAPDVDLLLTQDADLSSQPLGRKGRVSHRDINLQEDFNNSQFLMDGLDKDEGLALANVDDLDLQLDFGMDLDDQPTRLTVERGRDGQIGRGGVEEDIFSEFDLPQRSKEKSHDESTALNFGDGGVRIHDDDGDIMMGDDDFQLPIGDQSAAAAAAAAPDMARARISESPLSDIDEEFAREIELEYTRATDVYEPNEDDESSINHKAPQRSKKRKIIGPDEQTMLSNSVFKEQQQRHDRITKPQVFLPRDPYLLALMEMQKNGGFLASITTDAHSALLAPELVGLLSLDAVRGPHDLKRKRDSGIADMELDGEAGSSKSPRLEINANEDPFAVGGTDLGNGSVAADGTTIEIAGDDGVVVHDDENSTTMPNFDDSTAPLVHPADSGPVSIGTKHAVHILRDLFGEEAAINTDKRKKTSVVFQDLLPEKRTTKADATKMFFECLVLATKDAIKIDHQGSALGGSIRVRGKRGLWGAWAEREAGGEIDQQEEQQQPAVNVQPVNDQPANEVQSAMTSSPAPVSVSA
ncbi:double-strand-break repair protein rad21 [Coniella lustricola]|uniref:Double-strand-break repair protein rad21 n=1 Tax=Coniella lustricola TaxID=2025994 RepID=A0A2T3AIM7_9PEZI|nr:double-strand-break repair protein rad21 [Coniella lustricola]